MSNIFVQFLSYVSLTSPYLSNPKDNLMKSQRSVLGQRICHKISVDVYADDAAIVALRHF